MALFDQAGPYSGTPLTEAQLKKFTLRGNLQDFLRWQATGSVVHHFDDFLGDTINLDNYVLATGATGTAYAHAAAANGIIRGIFGTTAATSGLQIYTPVMWAGDNNCGMEVRFRNSVITERRMEFGFANALPAVNTNVVNSLATPTFNTVADGVVYAYDHATVTTTTGLYTIGTAIAAAKVATTTNRPVANTYQAVRLQVNTNTARLWVDGVLLASSAVDAVEGGTPLLAFVSAKASDTTDSNLDIDYVRIWSDRA